MLSPVTQDPLPLRDWLLTSPAGKNLDKSLRYKFYLSVAIPANASAEVHLPRYTSHHTSPSQTIGLFILDCAMQRGYGVGGYIWLIKNGGGRVCSFGVCKSFLSLQQYSAFIH